MRLISVTTKGNWLLLWQNAMKPEGGRKNRRSSMSWFRSVDASQTCDASAAGADKQPQPRTCAQSYDGAMWSRKADQLSAVLLAIICVKVLKLLRHSRSFIVRCACS